MRIEKIVFDNGTECKYYGPSLEDLRSKNDLHVAACKFNSAVSKWETYNIIPNLKMDLEEFAKDKYDLLDIIEEKEIEDFSDYEIKAECELRGLFPDFPFKNIINQDFMHRLFEISSRGDDNVIDQMLTTLEKIYHIK